MIQRLIDWLFRGRDTPTSQAPGRSTSDQSPILSKGGRSTPVQRTETDQQPFLLEEPRVGSPPSLESTPTREQERTAQQQPAPRMSTSRPTPKRSPIDLELGVDIGTSCTKAVLGDPVANKQTAIPLNNGRGLAEHLLPSQVFFDGHIYSFDHSPGAAVRRNLKIRLLHACKHARPLADSELVDFTAFVALVLRRSVRWARKESNSRYPGLEPVWHLNVGLPSRGGEHDLFAPLYKRVIRAAAQLACDDGPISIDRLRDAFALNTEPEWLQGDWLTMFPEASAQLASLMLSPYRPDGCLLVVDVGAGTLDISTLRVGGDNSHARCVLHCSNVEPLGMHFLHLARCHGWPQNGAFERLLETLPEDDGLSALTARRRGDAPEAFVSDCQEAIVPTLQRYRQRLIRSHLNANYRPWRDGLPYVLAGGGHRDPFYQDLMQNRLPRWLENVVSEWHPGVPNGKKAGLLKQPFPVPPTFGPPSLIPDFDRFSVAHGLALGTSSLMEFGSAG